MVSLWERLFACGKSGFLGNKWQYICYPKMTKWHYQHHCRYHVGYREFFYFHHSKASCDKKHATTGFEITNHSFSAERINLTQKMGMGMEKIISKIIPGQSKKDAEYQSVLVTAIVSGHFNISYNSSSSCPYKDYEYSSRESERRSIPKTDGRRTGRIV